jgi:acetoin utilization protein AcuB
MKISEVMTPDPYAAAVTLSAGQALKMLSEIDVRHLPVVDDGRLVGILSDRDLRGLMGPALEGLGHAERLERLWAQPVSSLMSSDVLRVEPEDDIADAIDLMIEHKVGALPVVEPGSARLLGIVSYVDVLRAARELF